ncbi:hypothetical protein JB92DRAFT_2801164 [Gautieria morchelliformis]|nr:hypothetical protein JB92DRAFT_2801164 [Gautieria morchelliformis]
MIGLNDKVTQGFKHPRSPKLANGKCVPHPHDWPLLLFDEATFDITNLCVSFLRNEMLAWRMIFQGPSAVDGRTSNKATKRGNALRHGMKICHRQCSGLYCHPGLLCAQLPGSVQRWRGR